MGWNRRERGPEGGYFYRSVREAGEVRKVYCGRDARAAEAEADMAAARSARQQDRDELASLREMARTAGRLADTGDLLLACWMALHGYRRHRGEWRRSRAAKEDTQV